jgi:hypothetical protein
MRRTNIFAVRFQGSGKRMARIADDCARLWNAVGALNIGLVRGSGGDVNRAMARPGLSDLGSPKESLSFRRGRRSIILFLVL